MNQRDKEKAFRLKNVLRNLEADNQNMRTKVKENDARIKRIKAEIKLLEGDEE